jgi:predicted transcriptional regulator
MLINQHSNSILFLLRYHRRVRMGGSEVTAELERIAEALQSGQPVEPVIVRDFLWWFGAQRRGPNVVREIRRQLQDMGLDTFPDFEGLWLDAPFSFILAKADEPTTPEFAEPISLAVPAEPALTWITRDPTHRISKLAAANQAIVSVAPDDKFEKVVTLLLARNFSQLPVMSNERLVRGMISWKTIGSRLALGRDIKFARDAMEDHHEVKSGQSIFEAIPLIQSYDYVLVRGDDQRISGIITGSDLSSQFQSLSEPFLLLSEIEHLIRNIIGNTFGSSELNSVRAPGDNREVKSPDDLSFGGYLRLLENNENWLKVGIPIDRVVFCKDLDAVRLIRNNVTHFDPDGVTEEETIKLRSFRSFLHNLQEISNIRSKGEAPASS